MGARVLKGAREVDARCARRLEAFHSPSLLVGVHVIIEREGSKQNLRLWGRRKRILTCTQIGSYGPNWAHAYDWAGEGLGSHLSWWGDENQYPYAHR